MLTLGRHRKVFIYFSLFIAVVIGSSSATSAQQTAARPDRGVGPAGTFALSEIESINLTNGN